MIIIKNKAEIEKMDKAGSVVAGMHEALRGYVKPGLTTMEVNDFCEDYIRSQGAIPVQIGFEGFPYATCCSVNDEICHGFPSSYKLKKGDLLKVDTVVELDGWMGDSCWSYAIGELDEESQRLMDVTRECLYEGIKEARVGNRLGDIGARIQGIAESNGFSVVREFTGHGIGIDMHEDPMVLHYGKAGRGLRLQEGMVLTIEPMINAGSFDLTVDKNMWTARTLDHKNSCQFEHTLAITSDGPIILTKQEGQ